METKIINFVSLYMKLKSRNGSAMGFGGNMYLMNFPVAMTKKEAETND